MTLDDWIRGHEFLRPLAALHARIDAVIAEATLPPVPMPEWNRYARDFAAGVPLLASAAANVDTADTDDAIAEIVAVMQAQAPDDEGFAHAVGWLARAAALSALRQSFDICRDDDQWMRRYCPTCGAEPAMAQLAGVEPGRQRLLSCGCCRTRWHYARTTCPFCEVQTHRLASLGVEGEHGLRIDYCESCRAYLKTYDGTGDEAILLADWTSLHLDLAACERGWRRAATSLYRLPTDRDPAPSGHASGIPEAQGAPAPADR